MSANSLMVSAVVIVFAYLLAITAWPRKYSLHAFMTFPAPAVSERWPKHFSHRVFHRENTYWSQLALMFLVCSY